MARQNIKSIKVKKVYPIKGRKDFYKYVILNDGKIAKDFQGKQMYFNAKKDANYVANAQRKVRSKLKRWFKSKKTK